jgi:hypothetical protein
MNVEDRVEMLGGAQAGAPPEVFAGMMGLTRSVISPGRLRRGRDPLGCCLNSRSRNRLVEPPAYGHLLETREVP